MRIAKSSWLWITWSCLFSMGLAQTEPDKAIAETPKPYTEQVKAGGAFMELSLNEAMRLALINNLQLEIENYNEDLNRQRVFGTRGYYDPILKFSVGWNSSERPNTSILDAGARVPTSIFKNWAFDTSLTQNVVGGGALSLSFTNDRTTTNSSYTYINPQYGTLFGAQFTQPLLRGFRQTQTERQLKIYNLDTEISDSQFKQRVSEIIQQVQNQYWELAYAVANYEARRSSLELAIVQYRNNQKRVEIGVMAPIEITSSRAEVATREQELIQSEVQIITAQNALKGLLAPDPKASLWSLTLLPTEKPEVRDVGLSMQEAIDLALQNRPELEQIALQLQQSDIDREYYRNAGKPAVNLRVGLSSNGTSGTVLGTDTIDSNNDGIPDQVVPVERPDSPFFGGIGNAWKQVFGYNYLNYLAAVDLEIPLRNRNNDALVAQNAINGRLLQSRVKNQQQLIIVDVRNAYEGIATRRKGLDAARVARELSEEQLAGENKRFEAGLSTNFEVLRYQRDLVDAKVRELRATVDYQIALTSLQKATFTIINDNDIVAARRNN